MIDSPSLPNDSCFGLVQDTCLIFGGSSGGGLSTFYLFKHFLGVLLCLVNLKGNKRQEFKIESRQVENDIIRCLKENNYKLSRSPHVF